MSELMEKLVREVVALRERVNALEVLEQAAGISDHGALSGLGDDDHAQYLTAARHTGAHPAASISHDADQSIPHNTQTALQFNSVCFDDGYYDPDENTRLTVWQAGRYHITVGLAFEQSGTGFRNVLILVNDSVVIAQQLLPAIAAATALRFHVDRLCQLKAGDYVTVHVYQNSGDSQAVLALAEYSPIFSITRVG